MSTKWLCTKYIDVYSNEYRILEGDFGVFEITKCNNHYGLIFLSMYSFWNWKVPDVNALYSIKCLTVMKRVSSILLMITIQVVIVTSSAIAQPTFSFLDLQIGDRVDQAEVLEAPDHAFRSTISHPDYLLKISDDSKIIHLMAILPCEELGSILVEVEGFFGTPKIENVKSLVEQKTIRRWISPDGKYFVRVVRYNNPNEEEYCKFAIVDALNR